MIDLDKLAQDFIVAEEGDSVQRVWNQAIAMRRRYIVVLLADGRYAVLRLSDLKEMLRGRTEMEGVLFLESRLGEVPELLALCAAPAVQQTAMSTKEARRLLDGLQGKRLVVLTDDQVLGLLLAGHAGAVAGEAEELFERPPLLEAVTPRPVKKNGGPHTAPHFRGILGPTGGDLAPAPPVGPLSPTATTCESTPEKRWINAEIEDHAPAEPLQMGQTYTLAFDVDTERHSNAVDADILLYPFQAEEQQVEITVQLTSKDFEVFTEPQKLRVPRTGRSRGKARFDVESKHEGEGVLTAVFLKEGNFLQVMTIKLHTGAAAQTGMAAPETLGRPVGAAFAVQPRDVGLLIESTGAGFKVTMFGAVCAEAFLPITLPELDQMVAQARRALQEVVERVEVTEGGRQVRAYQAAVDISAATNQWALRHLAAAGYRLYQRLFYGPAAGPDAALLGDRLRSMATQQRLKLQIISRQLVLPLGLLYLADQFDPDHVSPDLFLGLSHILEHLPFQKEMPVTDSTIDSRSGLSVGLSLNADIDRQMGTAVVRDQLSYWEKVSRGGAVAVELRETKEEVVQALAEAAVRDQILYFYCHAVTNSLDDAGGPDASYLALTGGGHLTLGDLNLLAAPRRPLPGAPLVFINACESAELSPLFYDGFAPFFMAKGARGVIGTEGATPALFAAEWASRFFDRLLAGEPLGNVFLELRREFYYRHNNLMGLLYAQYCDGDTRVVPGLATG